MPKRTTLLAALASAGAATALLVPAAPGQDAAPDRDATPDALTVSIRHDEAKVTMLDHRPRAGDRRGSESPGDTVVTRAPVRDADGRRIGRVHATFVVTGGRTPRTTELMTQSMVLPGGQVHAQGVFDNTGGGDVDTIAITGGSGRYAGARGEMEITSGRREVTFQIRLLP